MPDDPLFSVVIPSRNNRERLEATLESIARADVDPGRVEVVVVDDGSTDGTYDEFSSRAYPYRLQVHRGDFANQSAATNAAIGRATGRYVLSSASDILFDSRLFAEHLAWHERFPGERVAVLGYLPYAKHLDVTPFMFYLVHGGFQFAYYLIRDPLRVPPNFLYAPNFSVERAVLHEVGLFDEQFPFGSQDTDLGIRLVQAGVRLVYNKNALGYHNHPVELGGFFRRQVMAGESLVRLEAKHPDHEGGLAVWDLVLSRYLAVSGAELDAHLRRIELLEGALRAHGTRYQELWVRAFVGQESLDAFAADEREVVVLVRNLFQSYNRVLQYHWARGYLKESQRVHGEQRVRRMVEARLARNQTSLQQRHTIARAARRHRIALPGPGERDVLRTKVVYGIDGYAEALRHLEPYLEPESSRFNLQIVLVVDAGACTDAELEKLRECADIVVAADRDAGVLDALGRAAGDLTTVCDSRVALGNPRALAVARKLFERVPRIGVLGGGIEDPARGLRIEDPRGSTDAAGAPDGALRQIDVGIPEYCLVRSSILVDLRTRLERPASEAGEGWNVRLCRAAGEAGYLTYHLPELRCNREGGA